jgi:hypothetical protein
MKYEPTSSTLRGALIVVQALWIGAGAFLALISPVTQAQILFYIAGVVSIAALSVMMPQTYIRIDDSAPREAPPKFRL